MANREKGRRYKSIKNKKKTTYTLSNVVYAKALKWQKKIK